MIRIKTKTSNKYIYTLQLANGSWITILKVKDKQTIFLESKTFSVAGINHLKACTEEF